LKRTKPKLIDVAMVRFDVIADRRWLDDAAFQAILTKRVYEQLVFPNPGPASRGVPLIPPRRLTANAHNTQSLHLTRLIAIARAIDVRLPLPVNEGCVSDIRRPDSGREAVLAPLSLARKSPPGNGDHLKAPRAWGLQSIGMFKWPVETLVGFRPTLNCPRL
jgi:hypothetical protein